MMSIMFLFLFFFFNLWHVEVQGTAVHTKYVSSLDDQWNNQSLGYEILNTTGRIEYSKIKDKRNRRLSYVQ